MFEIAPREDPFHLLTSARQHAALEDAYLFGVRLRLVATEAGISEAAQLAASLGASKLTTPSLEDVFVSLARRQAVSAEKVKS
jgi:hypothetical protein